MQPGLPAVTRALRCPVECRRTTGFRPFLGTTFTRRGPALMSTHCAGPFMPSRKGIMSKDVGLCACRILGQKFPEILTPGSRTKRCAPGPSTGWTGHTPHMLAGLWLWISLSSCKPYTLQATEGCEGGSRHVQPVCCSAGARHAEAGCAGQQLQCLTCFWGSMPIHLPQGVEHRGTMPELAVAM